MSKFDDLPKPIPSSGIEAYQAALKDALSYSTARLENYNRYLSSNRRSSMVDYLPIKLDIENVSRCNFACTMCVVSQWKKGKRANDMTFDEFKNLIDSQYGLVEIKLNGLGEALLQGDEFFKMIDYARSKKIWVRITTNASLLHLNNNYIKLIDSGVNEVDISIDGVNKQMFEKIRVQSDFNRVSANCKLLNDYTDSLGIVRTKMWTLVQKENYKSLDSFVRLAKALNFKHLIFSLNLHGWGDNQLAIRNRSVSAEDFLDVNYLESLVDLGTEEGLRVSFWNVSDKFDTGTLDKLCPWPFERAVVTSDLRTVPCCMIGDPDAFEVGAGTGKSFSELWTSHEYVAFREAHLTGKLPDVCKGCYKVSDYSRETN
jgi:pyrroloquinoline quinone biosynthesis protein E